MIRWTPSQDAEIIRLHAEGLTLSQIAKRLRVSKDAVCNRCKRLNLHRDNPVKKVAPKFPAGVFHATTLSKITAAEIAARAVPAAGVRLACFGPIAAPKQCQWTFGDPKKPGFRFCGCAEVVPGRPYCAEHCAVAYVPVPERRAA